MLFQILDHENKTCFSIDTPHTTLVLDIKACLGQILTQNQVSVPIVKVEGEGEFGTISLFNLDLEDDKTVGFYVGTNEKTTVKLKTHVEMPMYIPPLEVKKEVVVEEVVAKLEEEGVSNSREANDQVINNTQALDSFPCSDRLLATFRHIHAPNKVEQRRKRLRQFLRQDDFVEQAKLILGLVCVDVELFPVKVLTLF